MLKRLLTLFMLNICIAHVAYAADKATLVTSRCLMKTVSGAQVIALTKDYALIEANDSVVQDLMTAKAKISANCGGFRDVSEEWQQLANHPLRHEQALRFLESQSSPITKIKQGSANYKINYQPQVKQALKQLNPQNMWDNLITLSAFRDRYANSNDGVKAANWIKTQVLELAKKHHRNDVSVYIISTGQRYKQPSVIAKLGNSDAPGIVISGHMDTLASGFSNKPGADDDGTGSVTTLETANVLFASGMDFKRPIYFMWYAAEEEGLVGSGYVVRAFKQKSIPIAAVLHFDMTGYAHKNDPTMWLMQDYVDTELTNFLASIIKEYIKRPIGYTRCGYGCSDHATWTQYGFKSALAAEAKFENSNPYMHSAQDTIENLSLTHMTDYAKLAIAFAIELGQPQ